MKVKLDENLPESAAEHLAAAGHDVDTAQAEGRVLVLRLDHQSPRAVRREVTRIAETVDLAELAGCVAVWRYGDLRVRRPGR